MPQPPLAYVFSLGFVALLGAFLSAHAMFRHRVRGATEFAFFVASIAVYSLGTAIEISRWSLADILMAIRVEYVGLAFVPSLALLFALRFTSRSRLRPSIYLALLTVPTITLALIWTVEWHGLMYDRPRVVDNGYFLAIQFDRGPWYIANFIYQLLAGCAGVLVLARHAARAPRKEKIQCLVIIVGAFFPILGTMARLFGLFPRDIDPGPLASGIAAIFCAFALFRLGLFELVPAARELALDSVRQAFFVLDAHGRLQDLNRAAQAMPGAEAFHEGETPPPSSALTPELEALVGKGEAEREFSIEVEGQRRRFFAQAYPVRERRLDVTGTAILVTDVTERARLMERLTLLAETDGLTGILNRRKLMELGALEVEDSRRQGHSLGLIMIDLDRFKTVNDRFGHEMGDIVLMTAVERFRSALRVVDFLGRYGGEEFVAVLPGADLEASAKIAARLRTELAAKPIGGVEVTITASFGVHAAIADEGSTFDAWLRAADSALYEAKRRGRDRIELRT
ncbi:MAG TPA: histidine kinase N-terminal 7TM domain-containing protein [Rectinemataceae bacterium]|nr:histidine kinase N-terminal 7TM domain-containing protein [Rectinemataceae bacterium]